jgi:cysteine synthase A
MDNMSLILKDPWLHLPLTPMIRIASRLYAKLETVNPTGSIKDRPIKFIVEDAIKTGKIKKGTVLVEATSGNTGIALSAIGASLGLKVKIVMPRNMSIERRQMMLVYGAQIIDVPDSDFSAAIDKRNEMVANGCWSPMQFENKLNIDCHKTTTAKEILAQIPPGENLAAFLSGAGTGGTIMGVRQALLDANFRTDVCMVVPAETPDQHGIQGIGDGADFLADPALCDIIIPVKTQQAKQRSLDFAKTHGVLVGISSGANLVAAEFYLKTFNPDGNVVTILCDRGERYLSELKSY